MEMVKKYGIKALSAVALIALFLPMASVSVGSFYEASYSGMDIAFEKYLCILLILAPIAIVAADYVAAMKKLQPLIQIGCSVIGIILTFVGYSQATDIAEAGNKVGMGFVTCEASIGFGSILGIIAYVGIIVVTVMFQKDELKANIESLKGRKK